MKIFVSKMISYAIIAILIGLLLPINTASQIKEKSAPLIREKTTPEIRLESYGVVLMELKKPLIRKDIEGKEQKYDKAYVITLKGDFPLDRAEVMELYIGDYMIPEYGGTTDGLYFKIYDPRIIEKLEGKNFRYRFESKEISDLNVRFSVKTLMPLKIIKENAK